MSPRILGFGLAMLMAISAAHAGDILLNSDFADGKTHWRGDGDAPDPGGKLVVTLKPDKWTVVRQTFSANATALQLKITYAFSDDCTLGKTGDKLIPPLTAADLEEASGLESGMINVPTCKGEAFKALVVGGIFLFAEEIVLRQSDSHSYGSNSDGSMTFTGQFNTWNGPFDDANLCLCFPPGQGTVTLTSVKLTPPGQ